MVMKDLSGNTESLKVHFKVFKAVKYLINPVIVYQDLKIGDYVTHNKEAYNKSGQKGQTIASISYEAPTDSRFNENRIK